MLSPLIAARETRSSFQIALDQSTMQDLAHVLPPLLLVTLISNAHCHHPLKEGDLQTTYSLRERTSPQEHTTTHSVFYNALRTSASTLSPSKA